MKRPSGFLRTALAALTLAGASACNRKTAASGTFETAKITRGDISQHVTASGALGAVKSVDVGSQVSGKISVLNVDFNSPVKKGDVVAEIDSGIYSAAVRQAEGELASATASATLSRQNLERKRNLLPVRAATQADLEQAVAEVAQSEATVIIREASLQKAKVDLSYCKITAPVDGLVIARKVDIGQTLAATMTTPVLFTIAQDITKMNIIATVNEADIGQIKDGQTVEFNVDAFPDEIFKGLVRQVRKSPTTTNNVVTYETVIAVDNPEEKLFPGMTADVSILVAERKNVLKIVNTALRFTPPEGTKYEPAPPAKLERAQRLAYSVIGGKDMTLKPMILKTGITDSVDSELLEGAEEGAAVVTSFTSNQKPGGFGPGR
ncbi:MAG: efflux RND transporter periplasmic adaptor subunit [Verrucomicrobiota bacterium]